MVNTSNGRPALVEVRRIWDHAPHNAFTDLVRFKDQWFCTFREGEAHVSHDGALRVIKSDDGREWRSVALFSSDVSDLRDAKLSVTPRGRLMLSGAERAHRPAPDGTYLQSLSWFSNDGDVWEGSHPIGCPDFWLWRVTWHGAFAYCIGKGEHTQEGRLRMYRSSDGLKYEATVTTLLETGHPVLDGFHKPSETSIVFAEDGTARCLTVLCGTRGRGALIGGSRPPYTEWEWKNAGIGIGGPNMIGLPDGRCVAAVRLYEQNERGAARTSLCWVNFQKGVLSEFLQLPSAGDTSYAGLVLHKDLLWVSYYSSHEGKANVYLATVRL